MNKKAVDLGELEEFKLMELVLKSAIGIGLKATIILLMVSLGMGTSRYALLKLWQRPKLFFGSMIAAFVVVPTITYLLFQILPLSFGTKAGLLAISLTPGAPMIFRAAMKRGIGDPELAASFQATVALFVVIFAPAWLAIISARAGGDYGIDPLVLLRQVSEIQLIPIIVGMALHRWLPEFADRAEPIFMKTGNTALIVFIFILLAVLGIRIVTNISIWTIIAGVLMAASAIIGGHILAGSNLASRLTIANANAQRNPGLALTITAWKVPEHHSVALVAVVVYLIISILMTAIYTSICAKSANLRAI